jgi:hypothetical protein
MELPSNPILAAVLVKGGSALYVAPLVGCVICVVMVAAAAHARGRNPQNRLQTSAPTSYREAVSAGQPKLPAKCAKFARPTG